MEANRRRLIRIFETAEAKGLTVPQLALAWLLHQEMNLFPIIRPTGRHIAENLEALDICLTDAECDYLLNG